MFLARKKKKMKKRVLSVNLPTLSCACMVLIIVMWVSNPLPRVSSQSCWNSLRNLRNTTYTTPLEVIILPLIFFFFSTDVLIVYGDVNIVLNDEDVMGELVWVRLCRNFGISATFVMTKTDEKTGDKSQCIHISFHISLIYIYIYISDEDALDANAFSKVERSVQKEIGGLLGRYYYRVLKQFYPSIVSAR